jgi:hypothetical protein
MAFTTYTYTKSPVDLDRLTQEISSSAAITIALDHLQLDGGANLSVIFKSELPVGDHDALDAIVAAHTGEPLPAIPNTVTLSSPHDDEGKPVFVRSMTTTDWHYCSHAMDFYTAKHSSLYNREPDGFTVDSTTDAGDAGLRFYDANGSELVQGYEEDDETFQARLSSSCTKTCMWFENDHDYDIAGAHFYVESTPASRAYLWVIAAPGIPAEYGGRVPFMGRGMNLQMMGPKTPHTFFAESCARIRHDPVYHSGCIGAEVLHAPGEQIGIQIIYILYEE